MTYATNIIHIVEVGDLCALRAGYRYQITTETAISMLCVRTSTIKTGTNHFHHFSILTPAIPQMIGVIDVGQMIFNVPGEWRKRFAKHLEAKLGIAGKDIFNFSAVISMLTEIQPDI